MDKGSETVGEVTLNIADITSPSQLQEVTLDPDASLMYSVGMRSPGGPMRGRSVKEFEEQLTNLRKENFNLKLRIYFLEERMGPSFNLDQENAVKKNIELMVELESLKKELQEKQDLLCQAVKAMELEEEEHRKDTDNKDKELTDVKQKYTLLQQQFDVFQEEVRSQGDHLSVDLTGDFYEQGEHCSKDIVKQLESRIADLEAQLMSEKSTVNRLNNLIEYPGDNKELREALSEKEEKLEDCLLDLEEKCQELSEAGLKIESLEIELQNKQSELDLMEKDLKQRDGELSDLQSELQAVSGLYQDTKSMYEHELKKNEKSKLAIMNRNTKISELESSLDKYKSTVTDLELKLQTAQNEVKSKPLEPQTLRGQRRKTGHTDIDSFSVRSSPSIAEHSPKSLLRSLSSPIRTPNSSKHEEILALDSMSPEEISSELLTSKQRISKLEQDQMKACKIIQTMLETRKKNGREIEELQRNLQKRDMHIQELKEKLGGVESKEKKSLQTKISEMNLTAAAPMSDAEHTMESRGDTMELLDQYKALTQDLDTQKQILLDTLKEKDTQMEILQEKYSLALDDMKLKDNRIVDLEFELLSGKDQKEKSDSGSEKVSFWIHETEEKDREIERLERELSKKTCDLQTVVNKELWEKNREIEKLQLKFSALVERKDTEIKDLKKDISYKEDKLRVLKERIVEVEKKEGGYKVDVLKLQENLTACLDERKKLLSQVEELKIKLSSEETKQIIKLKEELSKSENLRAESNEICNVLSIRLEELALFLDSLLRQKSVLGFLGNRQNNRLRQFIDQSIDLSRSLNMSLTMNPDQSLMQLTNISELLNSTRAESLCVEQFLKEDKEEDGSHLSIVPDHITLTYQSHLNVKNADKLEEQAEIIKVLRNQVENLKHEIEVRDIEIANKLVLNSDQDIVNALMDMDLKSKSILSPEKILENLMSDKLKFNIPSEKTDNKALMNTSATMKCHESDSESWSEPDRSVSKARIGLQNNESLKPKMKSMAQSESTELELSRSLSKTPSKKNSLSENKQVVNALIQQITELQDRLKNKESELSHLQCIHTDILDKFNAMENKYKEDKAKFNEIITSHELFLKKINEIEENLNQAENKRKIAEGQVEELQVLVDELQENKKNLLESMDTKSKAVQDKVNAMECEKNRALQAKKLAEEELEKAKEQIRSTEKEMMEMEVQLKNSSEIEMNNKIKKIEEDYDIKMKQIEINAESRIKLITESSNQLLEKVETEYVKKNEMDRLVNMLSELETLQEVVKVSENRVRNLEENETSLKTKLQETEMHYREKMSELRKELDGATLQYSEAVLQKTQMEEQKIELQHEMAVYREREEDFVKQVSELKEEFATLKDKFQKQLSSMENQKSKLLVKISELETSNADLLNKLIKRVSGYDNDHHPKSAPNSPTSKILNLYLCRNPETNFRKDSDMSTGFISESHTVSYVNFRNVSGDEARNADLDRQHANSSPDLGIESDHGRFSSLEANVNVPRPYLQSLELSQSMNQMLDKEQSQLVACANEQCCIKSKDVSEENAQLRKKLQKSNKLLEETIKKLAKANERKREVERNICNQITKTSQVLRKAKANLDSGSECELRK